MGKLKRKRDTGLSFNGDTLSINNKRNIFQLIVSLPFFIMGSLILTVAIFKSKDNPLIVIIIGLSLLFIGGMFITFRSGVMIDRKNKTIIKWWSIFRLKRKSVREVGSAVHVWISKDIIKYYQTGIGGFLVPRTSTVFGIRVVFENETLSMGKTPIYSSARKLTRNLAEFLDVEIHDTTDTPELINWLDSK